MSIFKKLFGKESKKEDSQTSLNGFSTYEKPDWYSLNELLSLHAGLSLEKQLIFGDVIGDNSWQFDMGSGTISFGDNLTFPVQVIGSLSFNDNSWMWGWANAQSGIPEHLLEQSMQLKSIGEEKKVKELVEGHFSVEENFEHKIGMIACGYFSSKSYYCANYGQGTLVVTIDSDQIPAIEKSRLEKVITVFPQLIGNIELNHKEAFVNYLIDRGFQLKVEEDKIEGLNGGKLIVGEFDQLSRLKSLNGKL
ncbi:DUF6882 domain-containing protein [Limibacter armeniacum]|uniref:DUF6882 domain-containing protein n=1 Tax=Limibacter armeniacum TaxID=466084 RepID=UPI002FE55255